MGKNARRAHDAGQESICSLLFDSVVLERYPAWMSDRIPSMGACEPFG